MKIPISSPKDRKMLCAEYSAYEENAVFDTLRFIRDRTMTRDNYRALWHWLRRFRWNSKRNVFETGLC